MSCGLHSGQLSWPYLQLAAVFYCGRGCAQDIIGSNSDVAAVFSRTAVLVLDEADRLLEPSFEGMSWSESVCQRVMGCTC